MRFSVPIGRTLMLLALGLVIGATPALAQDKRIALTFDDAPRSLGPWLTPDRRTIMLIAAMGKAKVPQATIFVNPCSIGQGAGEGGEARMTAYVAAGHVLANHSCSHPALTDVTAEAYLADIDKAEAWLKDRPGRRPWFRFPYLNEGRNDKAKRDAVRAGLKARGLMNGYVTVDASDWHIEQLAIDAVKAGKAIDMTALRDLYVESHVQAANVYDGIARKTLGRSPAHVLLLHETDIAAYFIGDLVKALRADGWTIISSDEAFADPINTAMPDNPSAQGTLTEAMAWEKGLPPPRWYERNNTELGARLFRERVLKEKVE